MGGWGARLPISRWRLHGLRQSSGMLPVLCLAALGFHLLSGGRLLTPRNVEIICHQAALNAVLATGMTFVFLAGGIDISLSVILALSAVVGIISSHVAVLSYLWPLVSLGVGLACGLANGVLITRLDLPPVLITLGTASVMLGLARAITGDMTVFNSDLPYAQLGTGELFGVPAPALLALLLIVLSWFILTRTVPGKHIYFVGCNRAAANLSGIDVARVRLIAYIISGLSGGVAAVVLSSKLHGANVLQIGHTYTLDAVTAVVLGGTSFAGGIGSVWGTLTGVLIIVVLSNGLILSGVPDVWQYPLRGTLVIGAVVLDQIRRGDA